MTEDARAEPVDNVADLLGDAQLIADFGRDAARIRDDRLFKAIRDVSAARESGEVTWSSDKIVELQMAIVEGLAKIHPVTLSDLKSGWQPFGPGPTLWDQLRSGRISLLLDRGARALERFFFVGIAIVAILVSLHYTQWQKRAEAVIIAFESGVRLAEVTVYQNTFDTFLAGKTYADLDKIVIDTNFIEMVREGNRRSLAHHDARREYTSVIRDYYQFHNILMYNAVLAYDRRNKGYKEALGIAKDTEELVKTEDTKEPDRAEKIPRVEIVFPQFFRNMAPTGFGSAPPSQAYKIYVAAACAAAYLPEYPTEPDAAAASEPSFEEASGLQFIRCLAGVSGLPQLVRYDEAELRQKIESVSVWLLPAVFGIFGAVVYHLRVCMDRLRHDPRFSRAVMRIVLGALGGIAFGWFWSPSAAASLLPSTLPLGAYAVAFLVGYSIDIFFAFLDRIVFSISRSISRIGTSEEG